VCVCLCVCVCVCVCVRARARVCVCVQALQTHAPRGWTQVAILYFWAGAWTQCSREEDGVETGEEGGGGGGAQWAGDGGEEVVCATNLRT
jgi:hypothetical protein